MSATVGRPSVSVPVLSKSRTSAPARRSRTPPPFTTTPRLAARASPDTMATGAARISGQGVATTRTATARTGSPESSHAAPARPTLTVRNTTANRSASRTNGELDAWASSTRRMIPA